MAKSNVANTLVVPTAAKEYPYYDDYNEDKNFHRILFRPGYAVQARELTQIQTIMQNQIERFGQHIFKEGSRVLGGDVGYKKTNIITLYPSYQGTDINVSLFAGRTIYQANNDTIRARVIAVDNTDVTSPKLAIRYLSGDEFQANANARIAGTTTNAQIFTANSSNKGTIAHVSEGVFFISGYFVKAPSQAIVLSTANTTPSCKVGLELSDEIITESEDTTLLDPALEASNYQAPGATRYKINLTLAKRDLDSEDDLSKFIELLRVENGRDKVINRYPIYSELGETLARRTYDESGDYTVDPFLVELKANSANANLVNVILDPGKAYVKGFEFESLGSTKLSMKRARTTRSVTNYDLNMPIGNYVTVNRVRATGNSFFDVDDYNKADIHCVNHGKVDTSNLATYNSTKIGTTLITNMLFDNTPVNEDSDSFVFRAYITDTQFISLNSEDVGANANTLVSYQTINVQDSGASTRTAYYNLTGAGNGQFSILYNTYAARNNVNVYIGSSSSQTQLLFTTTGPTGLIELASVPLETEILEHEALGGSRFIGGRGRPPALGVDDQDRFGIIRLNKFGANGGFILPDGTPTTNTHVSIEVTGGSPYEFSISVRANTANAKIALANSTSAYRWSNVDGAYTNTAIRIYKGPAKGYRGNIIDYDGESRVATVSPPFERLLPDANTQFAITFDQTDMESLITGGLNKESRANITRASKVGGIEGADAFISEASFTNLLYPLPASPIAPSSIANQQYAYKRVYPSVNFDSAGEAQISQSSTGTTEALVGTGVLSATQILDNYLVIVKDSRGSANVANGQIISFAQQDYSVNVSSGIAYFKANLDSTQIPSGFLADVYATSEINSGLKSEPKTKILISSNNSYFTTSGASGGPFGESNTSVYLGTGQVLIKTPKPDRKDRLSLYISDVYQVNAIFEVSNTDTNYVFSNKSLDSFKDVTDNYSLNNGQKENIYDHAYLTLRPGRPFPTGPLVVCVDYFQHSSATSDGYGYFNVDSYSNIDYEDIPVFVEKKTDEVYPLRDCIDFRPVRTNATNNESSFSLTGARVPIPNEDFNLDYQYYLPRIDKLTLNRSLDFRIYEGVPNEYPEEPKITDDDMLLYTFQVPAYTFRPKDIGINYKENKRYTMRDIGVIEKRVENLEYYSTLSLLEKAAMEKTVRDNNGLERTKYGILVDSFTTFDVADTDNGDFNASINRERGELSPRQETTDVPMFYFRTDPDVMLKNDLIFLKYTSEEFITQQFASKPVAVTDFLIARFDGILKLSPESDIFYDKERVPDNIVNLRVRDLGKVTNDMDRDNWNGKFKDGDDDDDTDDDDTHGSEGTGFVGAQNESEAGEFVDDLDDSGAGANRPGGRKKKKPKPNRPNKPPKPSKPNKKKPKGNKKKRVRYSLGKKIVDVSIIPYMREIDICFLGSQLRSNRRMYHFFDDVDVDNFVARPNIITVRMTNNERFIDLRRQNGEEIVAGENVARVLLRERFSKGNTGYVKLYVSPEYDDDGAGPGIRRNKLGFKNVKNTKFVSMGKTPTSNAATRTFTYTWGREQGTLYVFYNTYEAFNQIEVYFSNNSPLIYHANGEINVSSSLVEQVAVANSTYSDSRKPHRREIKEYLSIRKQYTGPNTEPSRLIGPVGLKGPDGLTDIKKFGIFELDWDKDEANTVHIIVGGDKVKVDDSRAGSPFQFAVSMGRANTQYMFNTPGINQTIRGKRSGATGEITDIDHYSGAARKLNKKAVNPEFKIRLERAASRTDDYYVGNTIYIVTGQGEGQSGEIINYNGNNRVATIDTAWEVKPIANSIYSIGTAKTTKHGFLPGIFFLPSNEDISFRTGERDFKITDSALNDDDDATSKAEHSFVSQGLLKKVQKDIITTRRKRKRPKQENNFRPNKIFKEFIRKDPIAQSFFVSVDEHPEGIFLESVDLFFANKDETLPVSIAIKKMENGYPSSEEIPESDVVVVADDVETSEIPDVDVANTATKFTFAAPIHLIPGEYAVAVYTDSKDYEVWVAEMGQLQVGTKKRITEQPYLGSLFKSQNDSTWTPFQYEDLMFRLNKCKFTLGEGVTYFTNGRMDSQESFDSFTFTIDDIEFSNTTTRYEMQTSEDSWFQITNGERITFKPDNGAYTRRVVGQEANTLNVKITMSTSSEDVSPVLDVERAQLRVIGNIINDGGIYEKDIKITNAGSGYNTAPSITITAKEGDGGVSANGIAVTNLDDKVIGIKFDNNGRNYFGTPTVTITGPSGSGATAEVVSEESSDGGNFYTRYITRKVTLADGFDAGDLKVYLDAYKPGGTDIAVYYRILSSTDNTPFERRPYILMDQIGKDVRSQNINDFIEYEFTPSLTSDRARYNPDDKDNQYRSFKHFAIKIVMKSNFECVYPIIKNLRVMALPEGAS